MQLGAIRRDLSQPQEPRIESVQCPSSSVFPSFRVTVCAFCLTLFWRLDRCVVRVFCQPIHHHIYRFLFCSQSRMEAPLPGCFPFFVCHFLGKPASPILRRGTRLILPQYTCTGSLLALVFCVACSRCCTSGSSSNTASSANNSST